MAAGADCRKAALPSCPLLIPAYQPSVKLSSLIGSNHFSNVNFLSSNRATRQRGGILTTPIMTYLTRHMINMRAAHRSTPAHRDRSNSEPSQWKDSRRRRVALATSPAAFSPACHTLVKGSGSFSRLPHYHRAHNTSLICGHLLFLNSTQSLTFSP